MEFAALLFGGMFHAYVLKTPATFPLLSVWIIISMNGLWPCWQDREGQYLYRPPPRWMLAAFCSSRSLGRNLVIVAVGGVGYPTL